MRHSDPKTGPRVSLVAANQTPATRALDSLGISYTVRPYDHDPNTRVYGDEVVQKLSLPPEQVFKTLVVTTDHGLAVGIVPVPARLDTKALARALGAKKASLAPLPEAEKATGYQAGGTSPFGQRTRLRTVVDASALDQETVVVSAGRRGLQVELAPADLASATSAVVAPIAATPGR